MAAQALELFGSPAPASAIAACTATNGVWGRSSIAGSTASRTGRKGGGGPSPANTGGCDNPVPAARSQPAVVTCQRHSRDAESISARTPVTAGGASWE